MAKNKYSIFILYLIFFSAFIFNEDSLSGARKDFNYLFGHTLEFKEDFFNTFFNYEKTNSRHSPVFLIINSFLLKVINAKNNFNMDEKNLPRVILYAVKMPKCLRL